VPEEKSGVAWNLEVTFQNLDSVDYLQHWSQPLSRKLVSLRKLVFWKCS